jgi:hypothetical protein
VNKIYCRCQLGAVLKMLLIRPAMWEKSFEILIVLWR